MANAGFHIDAIDASSEMIHHISSYPRIKAKEATFDEICAKSLYDGVLAYFSLLHVSRLFLLRYHASIQQSLKPAGVFFAGMKHGRGHERYTLGHYYDYKLDELESLLISAGFSIGRNWSGNLIGLSGQTVEWIVVEANA